MDESEWLCQHAMVIFQSVSWKWCFSTHKRFITAQTGRGEFTCKLVAAPTPPINETGRWKRDAPCCASPKWLESMWGDDPWLKINTMKILPRMTADVFSKLKQSFVQIPWTLSETLLKTVVKKHHALYFCALFLTTAQFGIKYYLLNSNLNQQNTSS